MDAANYLKTVDTAVASNTKLEQSSLGVGEAMQVSANKSVAASLRATEALKSQIAGYRALAASATESADVRARADLLANRAQTRLNSSLGITTAATAGVGRAAQTGERDLGKFTRGVLAGSGAASSLGRSLAFASTGFIGLAIAATAIKDSITAAQTLEVTQRQVARQLQTSGKSWQDYGGQIDSVLQKESALSGFTKQELLQGFGFLVRVGGNVTESLRLTGLAADVARARNISLASAAIALAKALGGSDASLKRLGITIPKGVTGMAALAYVQQKFAGQAAAGVTVGEKFHAVLVDTEETVGQALLPTFVRLTTSLSNWLAKMNETGRLQHDVNETISVAGAVFHALGSIIGTVDKVTGSFANTLKLIVEIQIARWAAQAALALDGLITRWGLLGAAAGTAAKAETAALGVGGLAVAAGAGAATETAATVTARTARNLPSVFSEYAGTGEIAAVGTAAALATSKVAALRSTLASLAGRTFVTTLIIEQIVTRKSQIQSGLTNVAHDLGGHGGAPPSFTDFFTHPIRALSYSPAIHDAESAAAKTITDAVQAAIVQNFKQQPQGIPRAFQLPGFGPYGGYYTPRQQQQAQQTGPFGTARPIPVYSQFVLTMTEQIAQAQAALTKTLRDDVAVALAIIKRIKRLIDEGHLAGNSLVQALQAEASAQGVLDSARQAEAQKAAAIAAAKQAAASSYTTPIDLQLAEARAELTKTTADDIRVEKRIIAAAKAALASGQKNKQGQLAALQVEIQAQQALAALRNQSATSYTLPLRLQLALAKAQATGGDQTGILLKMKAALEKALRAARGNIQKQIDIYNQIASINQQLGQNISNAYGDYRKASLKAETSGLGLSNVQRARLEERLSQIGPGGTHPMTGTGADGFIIDPRTGRPIHRHQRPRAGRYPADTGAGRTIIHAKFDLNLYIDGKKLEALLTQRQQQRRRHNPVQRRGPNAATATA